MRSLSFIFSILLCVTTAVAADFTVVVTDIQSTQGKVRVALYNSAQGFPDQSCLWCQLLPARVGGVKVVFVDLPPGDYAVSVYHDINNNAKLDTNFAGVPIEPYGFSLGARGTFGSPSFANAHFAIGVQAVTEEVKLK